MTDHGSDNEPDLWANTRKQPAAPSSDVPPPSAADPTATQPMQPGDPTEVQPTVPGVPTPTAEQPVTPGPLGASAAGAAAGHVFETEANDHRREHGEHAGLEAEVLVGELGDDFGRDA